MNIDSRPNLRPSNPHESDSCLDSEGSVWIAQDNVSLDLITTCVERSVARSPAQADVELVEGTA